MTVTVAMAVAVAVCTCDEHAMGALRQAAAPHTRGQRASHGTCTHLCDSPARRDVPDEGMAVLARADEQALIPGAPVHGQDALGVAHELAQRLRRAVAEIPQLHEF